jgi:hypothetical protein
MVSYQGSTVRGLPKPLTESPQFDAGRPNLLRTLGCSVQVGQIAGGNNKII